MSETSVLVVGAGPVGLLLACELARRDVAVRIVDRLERPTTESRAIIVHARSLEMLRRVGVAEETVAAGRRTTGMTFHAGGRPLARAALDTVDSPFPFSVTLAQTETERILTERLTGLGVSVERGTELVGLEQHAGGAHARLRRAGAGAGEEVLDVPWVAGADGAHSTVRKLAGTRLEGSFAGESFLMADAEADHDLERASMHTFFAEGEGPLMVFPMEGDRIRLIAQVPEGDGDAAGPPTLEQMQEVTDRRAGRVRLTTPHWLTRFEIHHAQVPRYRLGRVLLAGDAAHVHSPAGGQGMNTGMQDAFNLGWKLALVTSGAAGPPLLDSYHAERHPVAARVIRTTTLMTNAATVSGERRRTLRNHVLPLLFGVGPVHRRAAAVIEETDIAYRDSPIVASGGSRGGPRPGDAAPEVAAAVDGRSLHDVLAAHTGHVLLSVGGAPAPAVDAGMPVERLVVPGAEAARRYGARDGGVVLAVRPDGYLGARVPADDDEALTRYFSTLRSGG